jgi:hypothetical protein
VAIRLVRLEMRYLAFLIFAKKYFFNPDIWRNRKFAKFFTEFLKTAIFAAFSEISYPEHGKGQLPNEPHV